MAWDSSDRRTDLPANWRDIRASILERDRHSCQWPLTFGGVCGVHANEVDHKRGRTNHALENLWALCPTHHQAKTQREARQAKPRRVSRKRPTEQHPGKR